MSLINDALKKAQRDRENAQRAAAAEVAPGASVANERRRFNRLLLLAGIVATLGISSFSVWLTLQLTRDASPAKSPPAPTASPVPAAAPTPSPTPLTILVKKAPTQGTAPVALATPVPSALPPTLPPTVVPTKIAVAATPTPLATPEAERARIQGMINRLRISGIRVAATGNRALINDRLIRPGDLLDPESGLRILVIAEDHLEFTDAAGRPYQRRL